MAEGEGKKTPTREEIASMLSRKTRENTIQKLINGIERFIKTETNALEKYLTHYNIEGDDLQKLRDGSDEIVQELNTIISILKTRKDKENKSKQAAWYSLGALTSLFPEKFRNFFSSDDKKKAEVLIEVQRNSTDPTVQKQISTLRLALFSGALGFAAHQLGDALLATRKTQGGQRYLRNTKATGIGQGSDTSHLRPGDEVNDVKDDKSETWISFLKGYLSGIGSFNPLKGGWVWLNKKSPQQQTKILEDAQQAIEKNPEKQPLVSEAMRNLIWHTLVSAGSVGATVGLLELARKYGVPQPWEAAAGLVSSAQSRAGAGGGRRCYRCGCGKRPTKVMTGTAKAGSSWGQWAQDATYSFSLSKAWDDGNFFKNLVGDNMTGSALLVASTAQAATLFGELREKAQALADVRKGLGKGPTSSKGDWDKEVSAYRAGVGNIVKKLVQYDQLTEIQGRELTADLQAVPRLPYGTAEDIEKSQAKIDELVATIEAKIPHFDVKAAEGASGYGKEIPKKIIRQVKKSEGIKTVQARLLGTMLLIALSGFGYALYRMYYINEQRRRKEEEQEEEEQEEEEQEEEKKKKEEEEEEGGVEEEEEEEEGRGGGGRRRRRSRRTLKKGGTIPVSTSVPMEEEFEQDENIEKVPLAV
jgi:hypothetical protein